MYQCIGKEYANGSLKSNCSICENGYTQNSSVHCYPCPPSYDCSDGINAFPFDFTSEDCKPCPNGHGEEFNPYFHCVLCEEGKYCDGKYGFSCPDGTYSKPGAENITMCHPCSEGYICNQGKQTPCTKNMYSTGGASICLTCGAGNYTIKNVQNEGNSDCLPCPPGKYCTGDGISRTCTLGQYISEEGSIKCSSCNTKGYYVSNQNSRCDPCPIGNYCPEYSVCEKGIATLMSQEEINAIKEAEMRKTL